MQKLFLILIVLALNSTKSFAEAVPALSDLGVTVTSDQWYPVKGLSHDGKQGTLINLVEFALGLTPNKFDYELTTWKDSIRLVNEGEANCIVGLRFNEVDGLVYNSIPLGQYEGLIYVLKDDNWEYNGINSLRERRQGILGGYFYKDYSSDNLSKGSHSTRHSISDGNVLIKKHILSVLNGEATTIIESPLVMDDAMTSLGIPRDTFKVVGRIGEAEPLYIGCSTSSESSTLYSQQIIERLDDNLSKLQAVSFSF